MLANQKADRIFAALIPLFFRFFLCPPHLFVMAAERKINPSVAPVHRKVGSLGVVTKGIITLT